jgi:hypothetical protein
MSGETLPGGGGEILAVAVPAWGVRILQRLD